MECELTSLALPPSLPAAAILLLLSSLALFSSANFALLASISARRRDSVEDIWNS